MFSTLILSFSSHSTSGQVLSTYPTVDDTVIVVVAVQHFAIKLLLGFIIGAIALGFAQTKDLSIKRCFPLLLTKFLYLDRTPEVVSPVRLYSQMLSTLSSLCDW